MRTEMKVCENYQFRGQEVTAIIAEGDIANGHLMNALKYLLIDPKNIIILPKEYTQAIGDGRRK